MDIKRIIAFVDKSEISKKASKIAVQLGKKIDVCITIIYVLDSNRVVRIFPYTDCVISHKQLELASIMKIEAYSFLYEIEKICDKIGVNVKTELVGNIPYLNIIKNAKQNDLIIIANNKKLLRRRIVFPSISERILHHSNSPIMFVR
jgi:nucleotide-binding universal stress UspA family protein